MHAKQAIQCLRAGKHVQVEIPIADSLADSREIAKVQKDTRPDRDGGTHTTLSTRATPVGAEERSSPAS